MTIFFSLWRTERKEIDEFIALANRHHLSIKFTAEISDKEINFLDASERFHNQGILDIRTHFKPIETFQYTHFSSCNLHRIRKGLIKGESLKLLRTNSSAKSFYENIYNFKKRLRARRHPHKLIEKTPLRLNLPKRSQLYKKTMKCERKFCLCRTFRKILMSKWHLTQDQPLQREIYNEPPIISYKRAKSLGGILVRAKLPVSYTHLTLPTNREV